MCVCVCVYVCGLCVCVLSRYNGSQRRLVWNLFRKPQFVPRRWDNLHFRELLTAADLLMGVCWFECMWVCIWERESHLSALVYDVVLLQPTWLSSFLYPLLPLCLTSNIRPFHQVGLSWTNRRLKLPIHHCVILLFILPPSIFPVNLSFTNCPLFRANILSYVDAMVRKVWLRKTLVKNLGKKTPNWTKQTSVILLN